MSSAQPAPCGSIRPAPISNRPCCGRCGCAMIPGRYARSLAPLEDELAEGEIVIEDEPGEDVVDFKHAASPDQPSAEKVEKHRVDGHLPFRSWCKQCILGRGLGTPHTSVSSESLVPIVGMDYYFITKEGIKRRDELAAELGDDSEETVTQARAKGQLVKCMAVRCFKSKNTFTHVVLQKGDDEDHYCAKLVASDVEWLGHISVILKSDNEKAIVSVKERTARILREYKGVKNVQTESPPAYDSQSNGGIEAGIRIIRCLFRTLKLCLEARLGQYIAVSHALIPWLLHHACTMLNARARGPDGLTAWERVKGRAFNQLVLGFAECVLYKLPTKGPRSKPDGNMGTRWLEGVFLGFNRSSNTYIIATEDGVESCRSLYRKPIENRWMAERILQLKSTPWLLRERAQPQLETR